jgi:hypothetical protein
MGPTFESESGGAAFPAAITRDSAVVMQIAITAKPVTFLMADLSGAKNKSPPA